MEPVKIVIIDDNFTDTDPLTIELKEVFGYDNVIVQKKSSEGLKYVTENLSKKQIVMLDLDLGPKEPNGIEVFEKIREQTSLIHIIIMTAKELTTLPTKNLIKFINYDALAIINNTDPTKDIVALVKTAAHKLETRLDSVLEHYISKRSKEERERLILKTSDGSEHSLDSLAIEIRKETELGRTIEKSIMQLAIELLTRQTPNK